MITYKGAKMCTEEHEKWENSSFGVVRTIKVVMCVSSCFNWI